MEERFEQLLQLALEEKATDIHFNIIDDEITIALRGIRGLKSVPAERADINLFNYLQYQAHLDITSLSKPQSGAFSYYYRSVFYDFRLAVMSTSKRRNGVLRILNCHEGLSLDELTYDKAVQDVLSEWLSLRSGLILFTGLTGSGKTTTLYSLLRMAKGKTVFSLEDPIEVAQENVVQMEINEKTGFSYDEGIRQIMRHNPDIIMIGEIRDEKTAKMTVRAALTGCLVVTSMHSRSTVSAMNRLLELGVNRSDLAESAVGIVNQRLMKKYGEDSYTCVYDLLNEDQIRGYLLRNDPVRSRMEEKVAWAVSHKIIEKT